MDSKKQHDEHAKRLGKILFPEFDQPPIRSGTPSEADGRIVQNLAGRRVMISYSRVDADVANRVCSGLERSNLPCWIAPRDIPCGMIYAECIVQAIECSSAVLLFHSRASEKSRHVFQEVVKAFDCGTLIIPLKLDNSDLGDKFSYYLSALHWLDLRQHCIEQVVGEVIRRVPERGD